MSVRAARNPPAAIEGREGGQPRGTLPVGDPHPPFRSRFGRVGDAIDDLIETTVDAYGEYEQLSSFCQVFEDEGRFPWRALVVGVELDVTGVDFDGDERRGLVAVCRRDGQPYSVSLLDVSPTGPLTVETRQLVDAYRRWSGAGPLPSSPIELAT